MAEVEETFVPLVVASDDEEALGALEVMRGAHREQKDVRVVGVVLTRSLLRPPDTPARYCALVRRKS